MENQNNLLAANIFRYLGRYGLLVISILVFVFALLSGSEAYGGGFMGVVKNSPNALPWLLLIGLVLLSWKREILGGSIIVGFGVFLHFFFNYGLNNFFLVTFILTATIVILGASLILSGYLRRS